jgi:hypothetical protein
MEEKRVLDFSLTDIYCYCPLLIVCTKDGYVIREKATTRERRSFRDTFVNETFPCRLSGDVREGGGEERGHQKTVLAPTRCGPMTPTSGRTLPMPRSSL